MSEKSRSGKFVSFFMRHIITGNMTFVRWPDGPHVAGVPPIIVNFSSLEDKSHVWKCLKDGCRNTTVVVTQDSTSRREKAGIVKIKRKRKGSDFHANCHHSRDPTLNADSNNIDDECEHEDDKNDKNRSEL